MAETLSKNSKVVVFDSGVTLDDANVNNIKQGVKVESLNFIKIQSADPTSAKAGELIFGTDNGKLFLATADDTFVAFSKDS